MMSQSDSVSGRLTRSSGREMETSHQSRTQHARKKQSQITQQHGGQGRTMVRAEQDGNGLKVSRHTTCTKAHALGHGQLGNAMADRQAGCGEKVTATSSNTPARRVLFAGRRRRLDGRVKCDISDWGRVGSPRPHFGLYGRHGRTGSTQRLGPAAQSGFGLFFCDTSRDLWDAKSFWSAATCHDDGSIRYRLGATLSAGRALAVVVEGMEMSQSGTGSLVSKAETFCRAAKNTKQH
ncbi:hypothetical protein B0T18DRAFT_491919 [Schizothecium vesticola]|uniref:Uncharacterized protein n=1 Tax=Schizothecium vesticola TaxID=314040 RepID=A0AA40EFC3_9PEZI|nr:hypothetical protein B0T18DRAFT_491919 [Schizothecium vesticola]